MAEDEDPPRLYFESELQSDVVVPQEEVLSPFLENAIAALGVGPVELSVRIVSAAESAALNKQYRDKSGATNVLSFPCDEKDEAGYRLLGDLVVCHPVVASEALAQGKTLTDHYGHLLIHGLLHLLGYDHQSGDEADIMESLEIELLQQQDVANPYYQQEQE